MAMKDKISERLMIPTTNSKNNSSNIILNQNGVPCYNNINIYTNGMKADDINFRQIIFNKMTKKIGNEGKSNANKSVNMRNGSAKHGN